MYFTIDRFEGALAVLEAADRSMLEVARALLPEDAKEGSVLTCEGGKWTLDPRKTEEAARRIRAKMDALWK